MRKPMLVSLLIIFFILAGFWCLNALETPPLKRFSFSEPHMGTLFNIILYAPD